ncbi:MAG: hypothetical protein LBQ31_05245, partial [Bacteroidales bacterium]|nr:hypothetical protein [Bacteroidales bacterium]
ERVFSRLFKVAELAQFTPEEAISYEDSLKAYRDNINTFNFAIREATEKGKAEGKAEGEAKGEAKGILKLHLKGFSPAQIADFLDFSVDFVEKVLQDNKKSVI